MMEKNLKFGTSVLYQEDLEHDVAIIKIDREKQLNALNQETIQSLEKALHRASLSSVRSVILTGSGSKAFVAGADIKEFKNFNKNEAFILSNNGKKQLFNNIKNFTKPVVAAINGYALGGGLELALSCHIRIASHNARLGLPECSLGLIPGYSGTQSLPQIISKNLAMEMILTSKMIDSEEGYRIGIINKVVDLEELLPTSLKLAKSFKFCSPEAISAAIKSVNRCYSNDGEDVESKEFAKLFETKNFKEGVNAFLEKRKPNFT